MGRNAPIAVAERTAAKMMDMKPSDFRRLVQSGSLPSPVRISGLERWRVSDLEAVLFSDQFESAPILLSHSGFPVLKLWGLIVADDQGLKGGFGPLFGAARTDCPIGIVKFLAVWVVGQTLIRLAAPKIVIDTAL